MKWLKRAGWFFCIAACCEAGLWLALVIKEGQLVTPHQVVERFLKLSYDSKKGCSFLGQLSLHPYLGYTYRTMPVSRCNFAVNSQMLSGPEHPVKPAADTFYVLFTGGSVAEHLLNEKNSDGTHYLTAEFNQAFKAPAPYRKFAVIGAAVGDWRMPQQLIAMNLFHQSIDAVIDVSGFNELFSYLGTNFPYEYSPLISQLVMQRGEVGRGSELSRDLEVLRRWPLLAHTGVTAWWLKWRIGRAVTHTHDEHLRLSRQWGLRTENNPLARDKLQEKIDYHRGLLRNIAGVCQVNHWYCASFLQPMPLIAKPLSREENAFQDDFYETPEHRASVGGVYRLMIDELTKPLAAGIYLGDLSRVFERHPESIYADQIHYIQNPSGPSKGNQLLVKELFAQLEKRWKLKRR